MESMALLEGTLIFKYIAISKQLLLTFILTVFFFLFEEVTWKICLFTVSAFLYAHYFPSEI